MCEESRLEKERSAVLSELTMVNTIDYRMECQVLSALHAENQLSRWVHLTIAKSLLGACNWRGVLSVVSELRARPYHSIFYGLDFVRGGGGGDLIQK